MSFRNYTGSDVFSSCFMLTSESIDAIRENHSIRTTVIQNTSLSYIPKSTKCIFAIIIYYCHGWWIKLTTAMLLEKLAILAQLFSLLDFFGFHLYWILECAYVLHGIDALHLLWWLLWWRWWCTVIVVTVKSLYIYMINTNLVCILFTLSLLMFIVTYRNSSRHRRPSELVFVSHILLLLITARVSPNW